MKNCHSRVNTTPVYLLLYEKLRKKITDGYYPFGTRFLSKREIAQSYRVSLITAQHSLELLCQEGYLEARERSGFYISYRISDQFLPACFSPVQPVVVQKQSTDFPFSVYAKIVRKVISEEGEKILERVPGYGLPLLRQAISQYLRRSRGIPANPEQVIIGSGAEYLYAMIVQLFGREEKIAIETPSYRKIEQVYRANGAEPRRLPLGPDGIQSSALRETDARILHITSYQSFPSGVSTSAGKRREYLRWANDHHGWIVEDDYESEFSPSSKPQETLFSLADQGNVLYLNSFSRTIGPALRIAYLVLPEKLLSVFSEKLGFYSCSVPGLDQYILARFISSGEFERHLNRVRRKIRQNEKISR